MAQWLKKAFSELKRRKVNRVALIYVTVGAGVIGFGEAAVPAELWERVQVPLVVLALAGFPVALLLAWVFRVRFEEPSPPQSAGGGPASGSDRRKSIVVLPFDNLSPDPADAYFSDGLTEEIITHLSCCGLLRVISRNSAMALKESRKDTRTLAQELGVQCVLEGSVRRAGNDLRITALLIDAEKDTHLWAETYEGTFQDIFEIQESVAQSIVDALNITISSDEERQLLARPINNVHAYDCYLRARQEIWRWSSEALDRASLHLKNGLEIIGDNAPLFFGLGYVQFQYVNAGHRLGAEAEAALKRAEEYAEQIFRIEPDSPHGHCLLGLVEYKRGKTREVIHHLGRALELDPRDPDALWFLAIVYLRAGQIDRGQALVQRLSETDPLAPLSHAMEGYVHQMAGRFDISLLFYQRAFEMDPEDPFLRLLLAYAHLMLEQSTDARDLFAPMVSPAPVHMIEWLGSLFAAALDQNRPEVERLAGMAFAEGARADDTYCLLLAEVHALVGDVKNALLWLEVTVGNGMVNYPHLADRAPTLSNLRADEQFQALMVRVRRAWEEFDRMT